MNVQIQRAKPRVFVACREYHELHGTWPNRLELAGMEWLLRCRFVQDELVEVSIDGRGRDIAKIERNGRPIGRSGRLIVDAGFPTPAPRTPGDQDS